MGVLCAVTAQTPHNSVPYLLAVRRGARKHVIRGGGQSTLMPVIRRGVLPRLADLYNFLMATSMLNLTLVLVASWLSMSLIFAGLYNALPAGSLGAEGFELTTFWDIFFVSACVLSGVEIDARAHSTGARLVYMAQGLVSLVWLAVVIGIIVDRISRPHPRIRFSKTAILGHMDGQLCFECRMANLRSSPIHDATVTLTLQMAYRTAEGRAGYRGVELRPQRATMTSMTLMWTVYHRVTPDSPLYGLTPEHMLRNLARISVNVSGIDSAQEKAVRVSHIYELPDLNWGGVFADLMEFTPRQQISCTDALWADRLLCCQTQRQGFFGSTVACMNVGNLDTVHGGDWEWTNPILPSFCPGCDPPVSDAGATAPASTGSLQTPLLRSSGAQDVPDHA